MRTARIKSRSCRAEIEARLSREEAPQQSRFSSVYSYTRHVRRDGLGESVRRRQKAAIRRYRNRSDIAQRESPSACLWPVSGLASGRHIPKTAPSRADGTVVLRGLWLAYRCVGSAGFASTERTRTGFPFQSRESDFLDHLRRQAAYADESGHASDVRGRLVSTVTNGSGGRE